MNIDTKAVKFPKADVIADIFSLALNKEWPVEQILEDQFDYFSQHAPVLADLQKRYAARKTATNAMDFDDLLVLWLKLLKDHDDVREEYQRRFQFILVDEYQDTNKIQGDIIDLLAAKHKNVMVVGDDSQSIYSWRGAHFLNILKFPERYAGAKTYRIETNYRSTPEILALANAAIAPNIHQFPKELAAARKSGDKPVVVTCNDDGEQAAFVAQRVLELREAGQDISKIAVLYRSHFHALQLQLELTRRNIPFSITSGIRFFEQAHIKDVAAYLKLIVNPRDELSFKRIVRLMPGIGAKAADKLWAAFQTATVQKTSMAVSLQKIVASVPKKAALTWAQFTPTIAQLEAEDIRKSASEMIRIVIEAGYEDYLQEQYTNYLSRQEDLEQLASFALQFESVDEFLTQLALMTSVEAEDNKTNDTADDDQLRLSTIHQAKGLEFDIVFIIMLCDGLFPSTRSSTSVEGEEEERRLFYVAITRARNELYLSYPLIRFSPGGTGDPMQLPSRFLKELPADLTEEWNLRSF